MFTNIAAMKAGFTGGLVVDYPNSTKAKKYFLCLFAGSSGESGARVELPKGLDADGTSSIQYAAKR
jgi:18S rRNA (guanine1575-N7)-methyltransferase